MDKQSLPAQHPRNRHQPRIHQIQGMMKVLLYTIISYIVVPPRLCPCRHCLWSGRDPLLRIRHPLPLQPHRHQPQDRPRRHPLPQPRRHGHDVRPGDDSSPEQGQALVMKADKNHQQL